MSFRAAGFRLLATILCASPAALFAQAIDYELTSARGTANLPVAASEAVDFAVELRNRGLQAGRARVSGWFQSRTESLAQYSFVSADSVRCPSPTLAAEQGYPEIVFDVGPLIPGEVLRCAYRLVRSATSRDDLRFALCDRLEFYLFCARQFRIGTLPDLSLSTEIVAVLGDGAQLVRVRAENPGPLSIASRTVSTHCAEFGGGAFSPVNFLIESDFPGGCAPSDGGEVCINFGGQHYSAYSFDIGPIEPYGSGSCMLRLRPLLYFVPPGGVGVEFFGDQMVLPGGALAFDPNRENDSDGMELGALPPTAATTVHVGTTLTWIVAALLILLGTLRMSNEQR